MTFILLKQVYGLLLVLNDIQNSCSANEIETFIYFFLNNDTGLGDSGRIQ